MFHFFSKRGISADQKKLWEENGYLILRNALPVRAADRMREIVDELWQTRDQQDFVLDVLSGEQTGTCYPLREADPAARQGVYKLNSLFGPLPEVRSICHTPKVRSALTDLFGGEPLICASLNFEKGSQQPYHFDTWYMPPYVDDMMIAANFALEDVDDSNGPMTFYPGSHLIPPYRFSNGGLWMINEEAEASNKYLWGEIERRRLKPITFNGRKGDVFLWHAQLFHGGAPIVDHERTRNSLVVHYWRKQDVHPQETRVDKNGAYLARSLRGEIAF